MQYKISNTTKRERKIKHSVEDHSNIRNSARPESICAYIHIFPQILSCVVVYFYITLFNQKAFALLQGPVSRKKCAPGNLVVLAKMLTGQMTDILSSVSK